MALTKGLNAYATVEEADAYFVERLDTAAWTEATPEQKSAALVTATSVLDDQIWTGTAISELQALAFPRAGSYFDPRLGMSVMLDSNVPVRITKAVVELAHHLLNNDGLLDDTGTVTGLGVGSINLTNVMKASLIPANVKRLINPLLQNAGASSWWRAN